jgi:hypothetical protein
VEESSKRAFLENVKKHNKMKAFDLPKARSVVYQLRPWARVLNQFAVEAGIESIVFVRRCPHAQSQFQPALIHEVDGGCPIAKPDCSA